MYIQSIGNSVHEGQLELDGIADNRFVAICQTQCGVGRWRVDAAHGLECPVLLVH